MKKRYDVNGGILGCCGDAKAPLKAWEVFGGWHCDGYKYIAQWKPSDCVGTTALDRTYFGADDGICAPKAQIECAPVKGAYGENTYTVKTVYTDIEVDGIKDPAYDYGVHVTSRFSSNEEYYEKNPGRFDMYIIRGQDGNAYVFVEVEDPYLEGCDALWTAKYWRADCVQFFYDVYNTRQAQSNFVFAANGRSRNFFGSKYKVVTTDKGYNVEFCFDNKGIPFMEKDEMGFNLYMNDCTRFVSVEDHDKNSLTTAPALGNDGYHSPNAARSDSLIFSLESATGNVQMSEGEIPEKTGDIIADAISGAIKAAIVVSKTAPAHTVESARRLVSSLHGVFGSVEFVDDSVASDYDLEILLGLTNRPESREMAETMPYNGYLLKIFDNKLCAIGWTEKAADIANGLLLGAIEYVKNGGKTSELSTCYGGCLEDIPGKDVPFMDNVTEITDAGGGAYLLLSRNSSEAAYNEYIGKLKAAGYSLYTENKMVKTLCATLCTEDTVVNVTFGGEGDPNLRAVIECRAYTTLPALTVAPYEKVAATKIIQVAPNFMCYLIQLDNGEFIAVDSGNNGKESFIYEQLMKHSPDGHPVIAAWFFSHFHQDHIGGFIDFANNEEYMKNVTVKSVVYNFPEDQVILTAKASRRDMANISNWPDRLEKTGCDLVRARTGQKFRFGNAEVDMIYTYEDLMPFAVFHDRSNPTSSVISVNIEGQRLIITGDCCGEATRLMANKYGEGLKTDFVQLPHHGWGDGGTAIEFYELCDAPWVLYPGDKYAPSPSEKWACEHCKRYFLREFTTQTIPLPYDGGEYDFTK